MSKWGFQISSLKFIYLHTYFQWLIYKLALIDILTLNFYRFAQHLKYIRKTISIFHLMINNALITAIVCHLANNSATHESSFYGLQTIAESPFWWKWFFIFVYLERKAIICIYLLIWQRKRKARKYFPMLNSSNILMIRTRIVKWDHQSML